MARPRRAAATLAAVLRPTGRNFYSFLSNFERSCAVAKSNCHPSPECMTAPTEDREKFTTEGKCIDAYRVSGGCRAVVVPILERRLPGAMRLTQALLVLSCCYAVAGCSGTMNRTGSPAPGVPAASATGPDMFAAPPPPTAPSSTITVAPGDMYNLGSSPRRSSAGPQSSNTRSKKTTNPETEVASRPAASPAAAPKAEPAPAPAPAQASASSGSAAPSAASASGGMSAPASADLAIDALPMPVRPGSTPQSSATDGLPRPSAAKSVTPEVVPVSAPPAEPLDSRFSS